MCTNPLWRTVCAYLLQGNFLLYLERFWPSLHVHHLMDFESHVLEGCFSAEAVWPDSGDCKGRSVGMQWSAHPSARWEWLVPPSQPLWGCSITTRVGRTRWHHRIPAECPTSWLSAGTHVQSSPDLWKLAFTGSELGYLPRFHLLLNAVKAAACDWSF